MKLKDFSDKTAIAGVGNTPFGALYKKRDPRRNAYTLGLEAFENALEDSGLRKEDIDGVIVSRIPSYSKMCAMTGIKNPRLNNGLVAEGRMSGIALQYAAMAVYTGMANVVACIYGNDGQSAGATYGSETEALDGYNAPFGMTSPGASLALMWQRHMHEYGTTAEDLGVLAISQRKFASMNPNAVMRTPLTMDQYMEARYICYPLRIYDYCLINDGGVCLIVTSAERAKDCKKRPVYIMATGQAANHTPYYHSPDYGWNAMKLVADQVYTMAGVGPGEIDCAQIYDNFLPTVMLSLEGYGFCPKGESGRWIRGGRIEPGGKLPVNTSGGHCSESYMQGWALHAEAVRQLRGECGDRQVKDCETVQYICSSPVCSSHILRR